jgi:hypothetical protein
MEKLDKAEDMFTSMRKRQVERFQGAKSFRDYSPDSHDVFVATYPKSGTNWMLQIAQQLVWHGEAVFDHIHSVVPWPDGEDMWGYLRGGSIPLKDPSVWKACPERKRVIQSHLNWDMLPHSDEARYLSVIRDPKDVFVSNYLFTRQTIWPAMPSVKTWYRLFLDGNSLGGSWAVNAAGFWEQRHRPNVRVFSFKSMKRDLAGTVRQVAELLGIRATDDVIRKVSDKSTFDYMKQIDDKFRTVKIVPWRREGFMMRKGTVGGSSELLSREQQREMDAHFQAELKRLGSDLPYAEFCNVVT